MEDESKSRACAKSAKTKQRRNDSRPERSSSAHHRRDDDPATAKGTDRAPEPGTDNADSYLISRLLRRISGHEAAQLIERNSELLQENRAKDEQVKVLHQTADTLKRDHERLKREHQAQDEQIKVLHQEADAVKSDYERLKDEHDAKVSESKTLRFERMELWRKHIPLKRAMTTQKQRERKAEDYIEYLEDVAYRWKDKHLALKDEKEKLREHSAEMSQQNEKLQESVKHLERVKHECDVQNAKLAAKQADLDQKNKELEKETRKQTDEADASKRNSAVLQQRVIQLAVENVTLEREKDALIEQVAALESGKAALMERVSTLQLRVDRLVEDKRALENDHRRLTEERDALASTDQRRAALEKKISTLRKEFEHAQAQRTKDLRQLQLALEASKERMRALVAENTALKREAECNASLRAELAAAQAENIALTTKNRVATGDVGTMTESGRDLFLPQKAASQLHNDSTALAALQLERNTLASENQALTANNTELAAEIQARTRGAARSKEQQKAFLQDVNRLKRSEQQLQEDLDRFKTKAERVKAENTGLINKNNKLKQHKAILQQQNTDLQQQKTALQNQKNLVDGLNDKLKQEAAQLRRDSDTLAGQTELLRRDNDALAGEKKELTVENERLRGGHSQVEFDDLRRQSAMLRGKHLDRLASDELSDLLRTVLQTGQAVRTEQKRRHTCVVCMEKRITVVFAPCRHMCCCAACAAKLPGKGPRGEPECPKCRAAVESYSEPLTEH